MLIIISTDQSVETLTVTLLSLIVSILESVHACSFSKDQALVCVSAKCVNSIVTTLSSLRDCGNLEDVLTRFVWLQFEQADGKSV